MGSHAITSAVSTYPYNGKDIKNGKDIVSIHEIIKVSLNCLIFKIPVSSSMFND